jgi:hypothetical protein
MTPRIEQFPHGNYHQFVVRGRPFFPLAAELNNSSLSSSEYMDGVWARLKDQGFNTLLGSVTWEQIEPTEGVFDFTELDRVVENAKRHDMHLVLLWFGSFKNGKPVSLSERLALELRRLILILSMASKDNPPTSHLGSRSTTNDSPASGLTKTTLCKSARSSPSFPRPRSTPMPKRSPLS